MNPPPGPHPTEPHPSDEDLSALLDNAIKYTPENGSITITVHSERNEALIAFQDTGMGIPLQEQKQLANVAVDAVFDSVSVATTYKEKLKKVGVIFCSFSEDWQRYVSALVSHCRRWRILWPRFAKVTSRHALVEAGPAMLWASWRSR